MPEHLLLAKAMWRWDHHSPLQVPILPKHNYLNNKAYQTKRSWHRTPATCTATAANITARSTISQTTSSREQTQEVLNFNFNVKSLHHIVISYCFIVNTVLRFFGTWMSPSHKPISNPTNVKAMRSYQTTYSGTISGRNAQKQCPFYL